MAGSSVAICSNCQLHMIHHAHLDFVRGTLLAMVVVCFDNLVQSVLVLQLRLSPCCREACFQFKVDKHAMFEREYFVGFCGARLSGNSSSRLPALGGWEMSEPSYSYHFSKLDGATTKTTTKLATINTDVISPTSPTDPLLDGNLPRMIQCWASK